MRRFRRPRDRFAPARLAHLAIAARPARCRRGLRAAREGARSGHPATLMPREQKSNAIGRRILRSAALVSKAWPYEEARKLLKRWPDGKPAGEPMIFETGYGPSGLPHIGTFNEVLRTTFVRHAYEELTRRRADPPDRVQRRHGRAAQGARQHPRGGNADPASRQAADPDPDPFGTHESFAHHNNAMLRTFLDRFGFDYEFLSATDCYTGGRFDEVIRKVLAAWDAIMGVMLPTLRRGPPPDLFAAASDLADERARAAGPGRGDRCRGGPDRLRRRGRRLASSNRRSAGSPSSSGRSTGRRAGSRSASITRWRARI